MNNFMKVTSECNWQEHKRTSCMNTLLYPNCIGHQFLGKDYCADARMPTCLTPVRHSNIVYYWRTPLPPDRHVVYREWFWAAHSLFLGRDGTFLCPVTWSRRWPWSADLGAGMFVLSRGWTHHKCLGFAQKASLSCLQCCHLVSAEHAMCLSSYHAHCFVIGQVEVLRLWYTLMTVYVQRMMRGRHVCGKPVGMQHYRMSGVCSSHY